MNELIYQKKYSGRQQIGGQNSFLQILEKNAKLHRTLFITQKVD